MDDLRRFLYTLYGDNAGFVYSPIKTPDGQWVQHFNHWPMEIASLEDWILTNGQESDVYISPSLFREKSAKKEYVIGTNTVWLEFDGQEELDLHSVPEPTARIQTSKEHHEHLYWSIPTSPVEVVEDINRRLTYHLEADSSGWDVNQVLRPPGTFNYKSNPPLPVKVVSFSGKKYDLKSFDEVPAAPPLVNIETLAKLPHPEDVMSTHALPKELYELIVGGVDAPKGYRSTLLMHIGYKLAESGLNHQEIVAMLLFADEHVKKFHGRTDQLLRLAEIASIAINKVQTTPIVPVYDLAEFMALDLVFFSHWGDLLPNAGNLLLFGPPGVGKTSIAIQLMIALALNEDMFGEKVNFTEEKPLLFLSLEMPSPGFQKFLQGLLLHYPKNVQAKAASKIRIAAPGTRIPQGEIEKLIESINPSGVFFDTLSSMSQGRMSDEEEAQRLTNWDAELRSNYGFFTWYNHHNRKANADNKNPTKGQDVYGSYIYNAKFDSVISLHSVHSNNYTRWWFSPTKTRYGAEKVIELVRHDIYFAPKDLSIQKAHDELKPPTPGPQVLPEPGKPNNPPSPPTPKSSPGTGDFKFGGS